MNKILSVALFLMVASNVLAQDIERALLEDSPRCNADSILTGITITTLDDILYTTASEYGAFDSFPTMGSEFLMMSTGDWSRPQKTGALNVQDPNGDGSNACQGDNVRVDLHLNFPDDGTGLSTIQGLSLNLAIVSHEWPEWLQNFNDSFYVLWDAPSDLPTGWNDCYLDLFSVCNFVVTETGDYFDMRNSYFQPCRDLGCDGPGNDPGWNPDRSVGRTPVMQVNIGPVCDGGFSGVPISAGAHTLSFYLTDVGDGIYDTVVLIDGLQCFDEPQGPTGVFPRCEGFGRPDHDPLWGELRVKKTGIHPTLWHTAGDLDISECRQLRVYRTFGEPIRDNRNLLETYNDFTGEEILVDDWGARWEPLVFYLVGVSDQFGQHHEGMFYGPEPRSP